MTGPFDRDRADVPGGAAADGSGQAPETGAAAPLERAGAWRVDPPAKPPQLMNPVVLAYVGDAVFELLVRQHLVAQPNHKSDVLHRSATRIVSAKAQRAMLERWQPLLTAEEADVVRRGRNAKSGSPPRNADPHDYRHATALESLVGYLYYNGRFARLQELLRAGLGASETAAPAASAEPSAGTALTGKEENA